MESIPPAITIITVTYNAAEHLEKTIQQVAKLTYNNLSYIIVDGGSTDRTGALIQQYSNVITRWISERDAGIYDAMNKGWSMADPLSYILFLGAGDYVYSLPP